MIFNLLESKQKIKKAGHASKRVNISNIISIDKNEASSVGYNDIISLIKYI